jgi:hypothetical protein
MRKLILAVIAFALVGCASTRGVDVGTQTGGNFYVDVTNSRSASVTVAYTAGADRIQLGTVAAGATQRFVVPGGAGTSVTVMAVNSSGTTVGSYPVSIEPGSTRKITVR